MQRSPEYCEIKCERICGSGRIMCSPINMGKKLDPSKKNYSVCRGNTPQNCHTTNKAMMKRTYCFTTPKMMIIIFNNMEFPTTIKKQIIVV